MAQAFIILGAMYIVIVAVLGAIAYKNKKISTTDLFYINTFQGCQQPYIALKKCQHKGEKTLVTQYEGTAVNCERVNLICDTCGTVVKYGEIDCR